MKLESNFYILMSTIVKRDHFDPNVHRLQNEATVSADFAESCKFRRRREGGENYANSVLRDRITVKF